MTPRWRVVAADDDPNLLNLVVTTLRDAGHCVFAAYDSDSACELALIIPELDLMITNTRLGTEPARELIRRVRRERTDLRILHVGGPLAGDDLLGDVPSLREPFTPAQLLAAVAAIMGGRDGEAGSAIFPAMLGLLLLLQAAPPAAPVHDARHYEITLVPAGTGTHLLGEVQTTWRLRSTDPVSALLDSTMRVVRVLVDGRPNTRLSRTMYGRSGVDVLVPHQKQAGDSISTRIRYHGFVSGDAWLGSDRSGARAFVAGGWEGSSHWLPMPAGPVQRVTASFHVQSPVGHRAIANGTLTRIDTLPYDHATWHYRLDSAAPLPSLVVAVGRYAVTPHSSTVEVWTSPADSAWAAGGPFRRAGEMLDSLSAVLGPYPYPRLVHVAVPGAEAPASGGGLAFYPEKRFGDGGLDEAMVVRQTVRQWLDGADRPVADEIAAYLASRWSGQETGSAAGRLYRLCRELGDSAFGKGLRAFAESQRRGKGAAKDFAAAMKRDW